MTRRGEDNLPKRKVIKNPRLRELREKLMHVEQVNSLNEKTEETN